MAQVLHGSATTTARTRAEFQSSTESVAELARRHGVNPKTVAKWRKRDGVYDSPMGPRERRSTTLTPLEEAAIVAFRVQTRLPLDDVFVALKSSILALSPVLRCTVASNATGSPACPASGSGAEKQVQELRDRLLPRRRLRGSSRAGHKAYLFVAVDRTSKLAFARL